VLELLLADDALVDEVPEDEPEVEFVDDEPDVLDELAEPVPGMNSLFPTPKPRLA
jgi:hypothetical protein